MLRFYKLSTEFYNKIFIVTNSTPKLTTLLIYIQEVRKICEALQIRHVQIYSTKQMEGGIQ